MKKLVLGVIVLMVCFISFDFTDKKEISQTRKNYSVYLQNGESYVKSDSNEFPKSGYLLSLSVNYKLAVSKL